LSYQLLGIAIIFLVPPRKEFDVLVACHPGLGVGPPGNFVAADVVLHEQQRPLQRRQREGKERRQKKAKIRKESGRTHCAPAVSGWAKTRIALTGL
jgi:hypothetical protein